MRKKPDRPVQYKPRKRVVSPDELTRLQDVVSKYDFDARIEEDRQLWAEAYIASGERPPEATDVNAYDIIKQFAVQYIIHFGLRPLDPISELGDMIYFLEQLMNEIGDEETRQHRMIDELLAQGACWRDLRSPLNVGVFVYPDKWDDWSIPARRGMITSLQVRHNTWNFRHGAPKRKKRNKKSAA